jgi:endonuclease/exonuclease/phosphatase (EEP) superfamily protein YafD
VSRLQPFLQAGDLGARVVLFAVLVLTLLAFTAPWFWLGDLFVHFRLQYAVATALAAFYWFARRHLRLAAVAVALVLVNGALFAMALTPNPSTTLIARAQASTVPPALAPLALRVAAANVFFGNQSPAAIIDWVRAEQPDIVSLEEVTPSFLVALEALALEYPHRLTSGGSGRFTTALFSRYPFEESRLIGIAENRDREIATAVRIGERRVRIVAVHATWPFGGAYSAVRNREIAALRDYTLQHAEPVILLGDFNITPLSPHFRSALLEDAGLRSAAAGFGWQPTWPSFLPLAGIQIDHILVTQGVAVRNFRRGPRVGSDHWPIAADLSVP